ncbi:MAG: ribose-5-phosphate isomerase RpiA [Granulosicoccus sp.]
MHPGKHAAALAALQYVENDSLLGVGTGSTVNVFIDVLAKSGIRIAGCVASSVATANLLEQHHFKVMDLNMAGQLEMYIDGADEANPALQLIKGGGGALTREKIIAGASNRFVCIADSSKAVDVLGQFPLPIEIIPMARSFVSREIVRLGADPEYREGPPTDNGNVIVDCYGFSITDPTALEAELNAIPGVVTNGLFARRAADALILGHDDGGVETRTAANG